MPPEVVSIRISYRPGTVPMEIVAGEKVRNVREMASPLSICVIVAVALPSGVMNSM